MTGSLFNRLSAFFLAPTPQAPDTKTNLPKADTAWAGDSAIYTGNSFEKYNPDDLIGRRGYDVYKKMMRDEQVKAVVKFKRDAITSRDYFFELDAADVDLTDDEIEFRIQLSHEIIDRMVGSWMDALNGIMTASWQGFSMTEKMFWMFDYQGRAWWGIERLKLKPYDTFYFSPDEYGNTLKTTQKWAGKEQEIDLDKFIKFIVNPEMDEHYGQSELREAYRAWFSKDNIYKFRNIWLERHAGGFNWAQVQAGKNLLPGSVEYTALQTALSNIQAGTGAIIPNTVELKSSYPNNNVAFKEAIDDCDTAIARAMLVPNLLGVSPQGQFGSYSQSSTQFDAFLWTLEADARRLEDVLNEQLFRQLGAANFGDEHWPRFKFKPISDGKKTAMVTLWKDLISAKAVIATDTDEAHIRELLDFPAAGEALQKEPETPPKTAEENPEDNSGTEPPQSTPSLEEALARDSTIVGKGLVSVSAYSKALRRVDFAVISKTSESVVDEYTRRSGELMDTIVADLIVKAREGGSLDDNIRENMKHVKVDNGLKRKLNSVQSNMLTEGFRIGTRHAGLEVDRAKGQDFTSKLNFERLDMIAEDYFKVSAFKITGDLTTEATKIIEAEILNGARYGKTWDEVETSIYRVFATKGMISLEQAKEALGEALGVSNPDARLRTIVRTSTFDAINTARHSYFTDPALGGFVIAYDYSAVLDGRVTDICRHLDEEDRGNHSLEWYERNPQYRPPNHYNCRSLLIPVTKLDEDSYVEGAEPTIQPQEGFR